MKYILLTSKSWHDLMFTQLSKRKGEQWVRIKSKNNFTKNKIEEFRPDKIFIPHWSHIISKEIYENFECIVFHMTELPYGRGGSPLQNLIIEGQTVTKISAIKVNKGIDTGPIYCKRDLTLSGTASEIFLRSSSIIHEMIEYLIEKNPTPLPQQGIPHLFKRRQPDQSDISKLSNIDQVYDFIRMLDCEGYPHAFIETEHFRLEFDRASKQSHNTLLANVRIIKK